MTSDPRAGDLWCGWHVEGAVAVARHARTYDWAAALLLPCHCPYCHGLCLLAGYIDDVHGINVLGSCYGAELDMFGDCMQVVTNMGAH